MDLSNYLDMTDSAACRRLDVKMIETENYISSMWPE